MPEHTPAERCPGCHELHSDYRIDKQVRLLEGLSQVVVELWTCLRCGETVERDRDA